MKKSYLFFGKEFAEVQLSFTIQFFGCDDTHRVYPIHALSRNTRDQLVLKIFVVLIYYNRLIRKKEVTSLPSLIKPVALTFFRPQFDDSQLSKGQGKEGVGKEGDMAPNLISMPRTQFLLCKRQKVN